MPELFITTGTKLLMARHKSVRKLHKMILEEEDRFCPFAVTSGRAPLVIPQGPQACATPMKNENLHPCSDVTRVLSSVPS